MSSSTIESNAFANKGNVNQAQLQRFLASWLPPRTAEELQNEKPQAQIEREDTELFTPTHDWLGLGAVLATEGEVKREELPSNEKLRKQLLGRDYERDRARRIREERKSRVGRGSVVGEGKVRSAVAKGERGEEEDSEDEAGRSSLGGNKSRLRMQVGRQDDDDNVGRDGDAGESTEVAGLSGKADPPQPSKKLKSRTNYLDEVLMERSANKTRKKKKKKKKKRREAEADA